LLALRVHFPMNAAELQVMLSAEEVLSIVALNVTPAEMTREGCRKFVVPRVKVDFVPVVAGRNTIVAAVVNVPGKSLTRHGWVIVQEKGATGALST
jgi:hypothetical protein